MPIVETAPRTVEIALADNAKISVFLIASNSALPGVASSSHKLL